MNEGAVTMTPDGTILYCNSRFTAMLERPLNKTIGASLFDFIEPQNSDQFRNMVRGCDQEGCKGEFLLRASNQKKVFVLISLNLLSMEEQVIYAVVTDLSKLKWAEQALKESEERYRMAIESATDGITLVKGEQHVYVNTRFAEMFGYEDPGEIIGKPLSLTVHPDDFEKVSEINRMRQNGEPAPSRYEFKGIRKDGRSIFIEVSAARTIYRGEPVSLAYLRDITDYKHLEERLRQSQKMEAMGTLAGGIAHDFNNILAAIIGFSEMIEEDLPDGIPVQQRLKRVLRAAYRGRDLVKQILAFSRKTDYRRNPVSLFPILEETVQFLRASLPTTIEIVLDTTATSDTILASPVEVQQILVNLGTNAAIAMGEKGGILHISLMDFDLQADTFPLGTDISPGEYAQITVKDTGTGISPDVMQRIFEPFFTTREVGEGTGMGLAILYGIVKSLHGIVSVESEPGVGSVFKVFLTKVAKESHQESAKADESPKGKERVLFIDDEELLVEWGQTLLERLGYKVTAFTESTEAFDVFLSDPSLFDLVITDQTMPHMTGLRLARELLKIRSDLPVILCTGHSDAVTPDTLREAGIRQFLMKPLTKRELAQAVRCILDEKPEA
jgi:PAS domain S-box-containing protein